MSKSYHDSGRDKLASVYEIIRFGLGGVDSRVRDLIHLPASLLMTLIPGAGDRTGPPAKNPVASHPLNGYT